MPVRHDRKRKARRFGKRLANSLASQLRRAGRGAPSFLLALPLLLALAPAPASAQQAGIELDQSSFTIYVLENSFTYSVRLTKQPQGNVTVTARVANESVGSVGFGDLGGQVSISLNLTFTASNWNQWQRVEGVRTNLLDENRGAATITHTASSSADSSYNNLTGPNFSVSASANSNPVENLIYLTPAALRINEDATATYKVRFRSDPGSGVTRVVTIGTGGSSKATVSPASLTFTGGSSGDWSTEKTVTVAPASDIDSSNESLVLSHSIRVDQNTVEIGRVSVTIVDTISGVLRFTPSQVTVLSDVNGVYSMTLAARPSANVSVDARSADVRDVIFARATPASAFVNAGQIIHTFTPASWNTPVMVELAHQRDGSSTIDHTLTSSDSTFNGASQSLAVTLTTATEPRAVLGVSSQSVSEGGSVTVTVNLRAGDTLSDAAVFPLVYTNGSAEAADYTSAASVTVPAGARSGTATVSIANDNVFEAAETFTIALGTLPSGVRPSRPDEPRQYQVSIAESDKPELSIEAVAGEVDSGEAAQFDVIASNPADKAITVGLDITLTEPASKASGTVAVFDSADSGAKSIVLPAGDTRVRHQFDTDDVGGDASRGKAEADITTSADYTISSSAGSASVDLLDGYSTGIELTAPAGNISESGGSKTITIDIGRGLAATEALAIPLAVSGTAVLGTDYTLAAPSTLPAGVTYATLGTAPAITFTGGATLSASVATLILSSTSDALAEADETIIIDLPATDDEGGTNLDGGFEQDSTSNSVSFSITDDDDAPVVSIAGPGSALTEGDTAAYTISIDGSAQESLAINLAVSQTGAFVAGGDLGAKTLALSSGTTELSYEVDTVGDSADERDGSLTVALSAGTGYTVDSSASSVTVEVNDDDATGVVLSASAGNVAEASGTKTITVTIDRGLVTGEALSLPLAIGGTAALGRDYTLAAPSTLPTGVTYATLGTAPAITFTGDSTATATSATLTFTATQDNIDEGASETVTINLPALGASSGTNLSAGASGSGSVSFNVTDDDAAPALSVAAAPSGAITEGTSVTYTISAPNPSAEDLTIGFTVAQTGAFLRDADAGADTLTLDAGDTSITHTVATVSDQADEVDGSITFALSTPGSTAGYTLAGGSQSVTTQVRDDDPTAVTLTVPAGDIAEAGGTKTLTVGLARGLVAGETLPVRVRFAGSARYTADYVAEYPSAFGSVPAGVTYNSFGATTTITFTGRAGGTATSARFRVRAIQDTINEGASESIIVSLAPLNASSGTGLNGGAGNSGGGTFAITDDDTGGDLTISGGDAVTEGAAASFTINLGAESATATTVNYTVAQTGAVLAANEAGRKSVVVAAGQTSAAFTVSTASDSADEVSGSVDVAVNAGTGYTVSATNGTASVGVTDDDPTTVAIAATDARATEGSTTDTAAFTITLGRALVTDESLEVPIAVAGISAAEYSLALTEATGVRLIGNTLAFTGEDSAARVATITLTALADSDAADGANETVTVTIPATSASDADPRLNPVGLDGGASGSGTATITIVDAGIAAGKISVAGGASVTEGRDVTFTLTNSQAATTPTTVNVDIAETGSVLAANEAGTRQVVIAPGQTTATFTVSTAADSADEASGSVDATVEAGTGYTVDTANDADEASVEVADDDPTVVTLAATDAAATEGDNDDTAAFTLTLGRALVAGESLGVPIAVAGISAAEYSLAVATANGVALDGNTVTFTGRAAAARVATITFTALADSDAADADNESVTVTIPATSAADANPRLAPTNLDGGASGTGTARIAIADKGVATAAGVTLSGATLAVNENESATYTIVLNTDPGQGVTITPGTSEASDLSFSPASVQFSGGLTGNWNTPRTITVSAGADGDADPDTATITHAITGYAGVMSADITNIAATITDAGHGWVVDPASVTVEAGGTVEYTVRTLSLASRQLRFNASSDNTDAATVPSKRFAFPGTSWDEGTQVTVTGVGAGTATITHENRTTSNESNYSQTGDTSIPDVMVTVKASGLPQVGIAASAASFEEDGSPAFTVTSSAAAPSGGLAVNFTVAAEGDYLDGAASTSATIAAGQTTATITVALDDDSADEADGSLALTLSDSDDYRIDSSAASAEVALIDDDATLVTLSGEGSIAETSGEQSLTVALGRALVEGESLTVPLAFTGTATFGTDYRLAAPATRPAGVGYQNLGTATPGIVFTGRSNGSSTATLRVLAISDTDTETAETVSVALGTLNASSGTNLSGGASGSGAAAFTITDDDGTGPVVSVSGGEAVNEGTNASFTVTATPSPSANLSVSVNVGSAGAFVTGANLGAKTVTVGTTGTATFTVATVNDTTDEANGSVTLAVSAGSGYTVSGTDASASVAVRDNDATSVTLIAPAGDIGETGGSKVLTVALGRALAAGEDLTVPLVFTGAATRATFGTDYTLAAPSPVPTGAAYTNLRSTNLTNSPPTITFTGGVGASRTATLTVSAAGDAVEEEDENIAVGFGTLTATGLGGGTNTSGSVAFAIADDDAGLPVVSVSRDAASVTEGTAASFTVTMDPAPSANVRVSLNVGSAGAFVTGANLGAKTVTVGATGTATFTVATVNDTTDEANGSVTLAVSAGRGYTVSGTNGSASVTVNDNDDTSVTLSAPAGNIGETDGSKEITITLGRALAAGEVLTVPLTFGGAATFGGDYTLEAPSPVPTGAAYTNLASTDLTNSPPTITFTGGSGASRIATVTVRSVNNDVEESDETVTVALGTLVANTALDDATGSGTASFSIIDDDDPSVPTVSISPGAVVVEGGNATFTVTVSPATHPALTVSYTVTQSGSFLASGSLGAGKTISLAEDAGSETFSIATINDSVDEAQGAVTATIAASSAYKIGTGAASVTVDDNDATPVTLSAPSGNIAEDGGTKVITVTLGRPMASGEIIFADLDLGGAADLNDDYTLVAPDSPATGITYLHLDGTRTALQQTFAAEPTILFTGPDAPQSASLTLRANDDILDEGDAETVTVGLGLALGSIPLGQPPRTSPSGTASFSITDDDGTPVISIAAGADATEGSNASFTLSASPAPQENISIALSVAQSGSFVAASNLGNDKSVALSSGASSATFTVATQQDSADEPSGGVTVGVLAGTGYRPTSVSGEATATVNVLDNDQSVVTLAGTGGNLTELVSPATDKLVITLNRALAGSEQIAVPIEFAGGAIGTEFSLAMATTTGAALNATTGVVTFTSGGSAATVQVAPLLDADEVDDTITASLGDLTLTKIDGGARATGSASFDIIDAGPQPAVDVSATTVALTEGGSAGSYRVKLHTDPGNGATVTVTPGSADTTRVAVSGALTFTGGSSGDWEDWQTVTVTQMSDGDTANEDVVISHAVTGYGSVTAGPEVTVSLVDRGVGVTVAPTALSVQENASASYNLVLDSRPSSNVTITPSSSSAANATVGAAVTFTPATWNQMRAVQVTGADRGSATISHTVSSQDSAYAAITPSTVAVTIGATARVRVSAASVSAREWGAPGSYMVSLNTDPGSGNTVRVTAATTSSEITITGPTGTGRVATFNTSNWQTPQRFTVAANADEDKNNETATITHSVTGYGSVSSAPGVAVATVDIGARILLLDRATELLDRGDPFFPRDQVASLALNEGESVEKELMVTSELINVLEIASLTLPNNSALTVAGQSFFNVGFSRRRVDTFATRSSTNTSGHVCYYATRSSNPDFTQRNTPPTSVGQCLLAVPFTVNLGPRVNIAPASLEIEEGGSAKTYDVWLNTDPGGTATVTPQSGDAAAATVSGALTFNSSDFRTRQQVTVTPVDDDDKDDETVTITHTVAGYSGSAANVEVKVDDDDALPDISIAAVAAEVVEGGTATYRITAAPAPEANLTVNLTVAQSGDYGIAASSLGAQTVTIQATQTSATFTAATADDSADETAGSLTATLAAGTGYTVAAAPNNSAVTALRDNDATTVTLGVPAGNIAEADGSKTITLTLSRALASPEALSVPLSFLGTATLGTDYELTAPDVAPTGVAFSLSGATPTVTFTGPSAEAASFTLDSIADEIDEGLSETVSVSLGTLNASSGTNLGGGAAGSGSGAFAIEDDDSTVVPEVSIAAGAAATEGGNATFTVSTSPVLSVDLVVALNITQTGAFIASGDLGADSVTIPAGEDSADFSVATQNDDDDTLDGSVSAALTADDAYTISSTAGQATVAIADNDATIVTLANGVTVTPEASAIRPATFTVTISRALVAGESVSAPLVYAGRRSGAFSLRGSPSGISFSSNAVVFTGGASADTVATIAFTSDRDVGDDNDDNVMVSFGNVTATGLGGGANSAGSAAFTVIDAQASVQTISIEAGPDITEGGTATFTITTSRPFGDAPGVPSTRAIGVSISTRGAASLSSSFATSRTVTIPVGSASASFTVPTQTDDADLPNGAVVATILSSSNWRVRQGEGAAEVAVADDDATTFEASLASNGFFLREVDAVLEQTTRNNQIGFTFSRALVAGETLVIPLAFTGGAAGEDFFLRTTLEPDATPLTWASFSQSGVLTVTGPSNTTLNAFLVALDDDDGINERVSLTSFGAIAHTGLGGGATGSVENPGWSFEIFDNDEPSGPAISIAADADVTEGTAASFTLSASPAPAAELEVSLTVAQEGDVVASNNLGASSVTFAADATSATFTVATVADSTDEADGSVTVTVNTGSGYEPGSPRSASAAVADNDATSVTLAVTDASATEGDSDAAGAFTVTLGRALVTGESITAPLAFSGATVGDEFSVALAAATGISFNAGASTLTFTGGASAARVATLTVTAEADDNFANETLAISLGALTSTGLGGGVSGAGSGSIAIADAGVPVPVISITAGADITEGGTASFTVGASPAPAAELAVSLTVSQQGSYVASNNLGAATVTLAANATSATFTVATEDDSIDEPNGAVTLAVASGEGYRPSASDGSDEVAVADGEATSVTLAVTDASAAERDSTATAAFTVTLGRTLAAGEGLTVALGFAGGASGDDFTLALGAATGISFASATNTLTFAGGASAARVATLTLTAADDADITDETVTVSLGAITPSGLGGGAAGSRTGNGEIVITDAGVIPAVVVSGSPVSLTEGGDAGSYTVALATDPGATVTVTPTSSDDSAVTVSGPLTFNSSNFSAAQPITVTPVDDGDIGNESVAITHAVAGYTGVTSAPNATVTVTDRGRGVVVEPVSIAIDQGEEETYSVVLLSQPVGSGATVNITAASADESVAEVSGAPAFTAANWDTPQNFTVSGAGGGSTSITHSIVSTDAGYRAITPSAVSVSVTAVPGVSLSASAIAVSERGAAGGYDVVLATNPGAEVTVTPTSADPSAVTVSGALTFNAANWSTPQRVTVTPEIDNDATGETVLISHAVTGYTGASTPDNITVTVTDFGHAILVEPADLSLPAGETASYTLTLTSAPTGGVTITPASAAAATATVGSAVTLNAADANTPVSIVVTGIAVGQTSITHQVTTADPNYGAVSAAAVAVEVTPAASVRITPAALDIDEGGADGSYQVVLGTDPGATVTVTPSSGDTGAVTVGGALTFNSTNWSQAQTVTVSAVDDGDRDDESVTISHQVSGYPGVASAPDVTVAVADDDSLPTVSVSAMPASATEGGNATFRVSASPPPATDLAVSLALAADGGFVAAESLGSRSVIIAANAEFSNVTLAVANDDIDRPNGLITATLAAPAADAGYLLAAASGNAARIALIDNDATGVTLASDADEGIDESGGSVSFSVALSRALQAGEELDVTLALSGSAALGTDYTLSAPSPVPAGIAFSGLDSAPIITFTGGAGAASATMLTLTAVSDTFDEGDGETVSIALAMLDSTSGTGLGGGASGTGAVSFEIVDDDASVALPAVSVSAGPGVTEGAEALFTIAASPAPDAEIRVGLRVSDSGAFVAAADTGERFVTLSASQPSASISVATIDDEIDEADGMVSVALQAGTGYIRSQTDASASLAVTDDDATAVSLSSSAIDAAKDRSVVVTVTIGRALEAGERIEVELSLGGEAVLGVDYVLRAPDMIPPGVEYAMLDTAPRIIFTGNAAASSLSAPRSIFASASAFSPAARGILPGAAASSLSAPIVIVPIADSSDERGDRSVSVSIAPSPEVAPAGNADGSAERVDIDIVEPGDGMDPVVVDPSLTVSQSSLTLDEGGSVSYTVALGARPSGPVTVAVAVSDGAGVELSSASLMFSADAWNVAQSLTVTALEDADIADETGALSHTASGGGYDGVSAEVSVSVSDNDDPSLAVSESSLTLDEGGSVSYTVALGARPSGPVTVAVAVSEGAGVELSSASLMFSADTWNVAQSLTVTALEDADSVDETGSLSHTASGGGYDGVSAEVAVSVSDNDDPFTAAVSSAWLARFGRAVSEQILEGIGDRVASHQRVGAMHSAAAGGESSGVSFEAMFAGQRIGADGAPVAESLGASPRFGGALPAHGQGAGAGMRFGGGLSGQSQGGMLDAPFGGSGSLGAGGLGAGTGSIFDSAAPSDPFGSASGADSEDRSLERMMQAVVGGSSFNAAGRSSPRMSWGLWGRGSVAALEGRSADGIAVEGDVMTGQLGADWAISNWLLGLSLSYSQGDGEYVGADGGGAMESTMAAATPYIRVGTDRFSAWAAAGAGRGEMTFTPEQGLSSETDIEMEMGAVGLRGELLRFGNGLSVSLLSDAMAMRSASEDQAGMPLMEAELSRIRAAVEASWAIRTSGGGQFSMRVEGGARQDEGDAEEGMGSEVSAGLSWMQGGFIFELEGRHLVEHEDEDFIQTGASVFLAWDAAGATGFGPSLSVRQQWGINTASGLEQLFAMRHMDHFRLESGMRRIETEFGWGLPLFGERFVGTPFLMHGAQDSGRLQTLGWRLEPFDKDDNGLLDLGMSLKLTRRIGIADKPDHGISLEARLGF